MYILIIHGTNRENNQSQKVARLVLKKAREYDFETELISPDDIKLSFDSYAEKLADKNIEFREKIKRADGYIFVTPEYNHGIPGTLKTIIDMFYSEYHKKAVGLVGVSSGPWGGVRAIESMLPILKTTGLVTIRPDLQFPNVNEMFNENEDFQKEDEYRDRFNTFFDELIWISETLKEKRENESR